MAIDNVYIESIVTFVMPQFRVSYHNAERMKDWIASRSKGKAVLRERKGNSGLYEWTFDEALDELLTEVGF